MIDSLNKLLSEREKQIANDAAIAMRDRCVAKLRRLMEHEVNGHRHGALLDAIRSIEALTLDQVEQEKQT